MEFFDVIARRGSYREAFVNEPVPEENIRKIVTAGIQAPSGFNCQTSSFVVVTDSKLKEEISALMPTPATQTAPVILVVLSEYVEAHPGMAFEVEDYAASTENIMLSITAMGYAGVWMDGMTKKDGNREKIKEILRIPEGKTVRTIIPFGIPQQQVTQKEKKPYEERVQYNRFA